jgi:DNA-binding NtrC family response regulator
MGSPQHRQCRILIVDDHADTRDLLERLLSRRFEVATASCYDSALARAEMRTPDIVITDVGLPGRDGVALMRELSRRYGVTGIAVTGHEIDRATEFREAGFVHWLRKPIQLGDLLDALTAAQLEPCGDEITTGQPLSRPSA